jgi:translation initiation factor eIF-2B subunit delta
LVGTLQPTPVALLLVQVGDPSELVRSEGPEGVGVLDKWSDIPSLKLLNLRYDLTPMKYVSLVITESGLIPPTSVPVLIREYKAQKDSGANLEL